jgi:hypothetical protein
LQSGSYEIEPWAKRGVWERLFKALASEADNEYAMIDRTESACSSAQRWSP